MKADRVKQLSNAARFTAILSQNHPFCNPYQEKILDSGEKIWYNRQIIYEKGVDSP